MDTVFTQLVEKYLTNSLTAEEEQELVRLSRDEQNMAQLQALIDDDLLQGKFIQEHNAEQGRLMYNRLLQKIEGGKVIPVNWWKRGVAIAAAIVVLAVAGYWLFVETKPVAPGKTPVTTSADVQAPKTNRAMITLANGQKVYLDSAANGTLATQNNVKVVKLANGQVTYQTEPGQAITEVKYNTLENPRGSQVIAITLADGTKVWLNAGSYVTYPVAFAGSERKVSITGEAYFEVAHDKTKPFYVSKADVQVQVLGTHFNVNAYDDEDAIKVTLLEGSVRVTLSRQAGTQGDKDVVIKPGEQALTTNPAGGGTGKKLQTTNNIDVEQVMAWKNGRFQFNNTDLKTVMRQLSRWYDIEVLYEINAPVHEQFYGKLQRNLDLSEVLFILQKSQVRFRIEGKKLIVMK